jgi:hypothetical protein
LSIVSPIRPTRATRCVPTTTAETPFKTNQVYLGTFVDDPDDLQHIEKVRSFCSDLHVARLEPKFAKIRSLNALFADDPLTLRYYRDAALQDWVDSICSQKKLMPLSFSVRRWLSTSSQRPDCPSLLTLSMLTRPNGRNTPPTTAGRCPGYIVGKANIYSLMSGKLQPAPHDHSS